jgi:hypothetical protein
MTDQSLFPDLAPTIEERISAIDQHILRLLCENARTSVLEHDEKRVLRFIRYRRGSTNAITIKQIQEAMEVGPGVRVLSEREIKQIVRTLRLNHGVPIGSNKGGMGGYFIMVSPEDHAILSNQILDQVRAELEVLKATSGRHAALELLGQLQLEVEASHV